LSCVWARIEAMGLWALGIGLVEIGEYEEGLEVCLRGTEMARKLPTVFLVWRTLDHLVRAYEALLDLRDQRAESEANMGISDPTGFQRLFDLAVSYIVGLGQWAEEKEQSR
jgi:hypothetical protein